MIGVCILLWLASFVAGKPTASDVETPPGVILGTDYKSVPIPKTKYQVYLVGDFHGARETKWFLEGFLARLNQEVGLRDVAVEEDQVYERAAIDYVDGKVDRLPAALCLRTDVLDMIKAFNASVAADRRVRVHLVDIDSPMQAIREHLLLLKEKLGAHQVVIPDEESLRRTGLELIQKIKPLASEEGSKAELETIKSSIIANREGIEVGTSLPKGNPLHESREGAIARNLLRVLKCAGKGGVLAFYGSTHVTRKRERMLWPTDGSMYYDYKPLGLRLAEAGIKVAVIPSVALSGSTFWRGSTLVIPPTAKSYRFSPQVSAEDLIASVPGVKYIWLDLQTVSWSGSSPDTSRYKFWDFMILFKEATPMKDPCSAGGQ